MYSRQKEYWYHNRLTIKDINAVAHSLTRCLQNVKQTKNDMDIKSLTISSLSKISKLLLAVIILVCVAAIVIVTFKICNRHKSYWYQRCRYLGSLVSNKCSFEACELVVMVIGHHDYCNRNDFDSHEHSLVTKVILQRHQR